MRLSQVFSYLLLWVQCCICCLLELLGCGRWAVWVWRSTFGKRSPHGFCEKPSTTHGCSTICMFTPGYGMLGSYFHIFSCFWVTLPIRKAQCQAWIQPQTGCWIGVPFLSIRLWGSTLLLPNPGLFRFIHPGLTSDHQLWLSSRQVVRSSEISFCGKSPSGSSSEPLVEGGSECRYL